MSRKIRLLGPPFVRRDGQLAESPGGRKAWGLLAYLILTDQPPSRSRAAELLFPDAQDPMRALRWNLTELRRLLGGPDVVGGDPVELRLEAGDDVDVHSVVSSSWPDPADLAGLGGELLEGLVFDGTPTFAAWLDLERHHLRAATEALLAELAVGELTGGRYATAAELAVRAVQLDELNAGHHSLLVASLVAMGDLGGAHAHVTRCRELYQDRLGVPLPIEIEAALAAPTTALSAAVPVEAVIRAALVTGQGAMSAGAVAHGLACLREAADLSSGASPSLRAEVLVELGSALVHGTGDRGVSSARCLQEAYRCAEAAGLPALAAHAARELGFVQVQLGRRERASAWLDKADQLATGPGERSRVLGIRGMNYSDAGRYEEALASCAESVYLAEQAGHVRSLAWSLSMTGRIRLLQGDFGKAALVLSRAADLVAQEHWITFSPWVEALRAEALIGQGRTGEAGDRLDRSYALARAMGDHCWIAMNARALALARAAEGDLTGALNWVEDSLRREPWYLWTHGYALQAGVALAEAADDRRAGQWYAEFARLEGRAQLGWRRDAPKIARAGRNQERHIRPHAAGAGEVAVAARPSRATARTS